MRLLLDECAAGRYLRDRLIAAGHDVLRSVDVLAGGADDRAVFAFACQNDRTVTTFNSADFARLALEEMSDFGGFMCPVCGFVGLDEPPRVGNTMSHEICICCLFQFGITDSNRSVMPSAYRGVWVAAGMPWRGISRSAPTGWDPVAQVTSIPAKLIKQYNRALPPAKNWTNPEDPPPSRKQD